MNLLTCTWSPHVYTGIGFRNFQRPMPAGGLCNVLGATKYGIPLIMYPENREVECAGDMKWIPREECFEQVKKFDGEFPAKYFDITEQHFRDVYDSWRSPNLWDKVGGGWRLWHSVWGSGNEDRRPLSPGTH